MHAGVNAWVGYAAGAGEQGHVGVLVPTPHGWRGLSEGEGTAGRRGPATLACSGPCCALCALMQLVVHVCSVGGAGSCTGRGVNVSVSVNVNVNVLLVRASVESVTYACMQKEDDQEGALAACARAGVARIRRGILCRTPTRCCSCRR